MAEALSLDAFGGFAFDMQKQAFWIMKPFLSKRFALANQNLAFQGYLNT